ncbi:hypothetical protein Bbelb_108950 [Branchiostoma belcheri]|nr:hypothetical protein Bbelb_108950 [Branchiostoma belcheri]
MRRFWTYIKSQRTEAASVAPLKVDGRLTTEAKDRAEALNKQFQCAFSQMVTCTEEEFRLRTNLNTQSGTPTCSSNNISESGVRKLMQNLEPRKAPGPDGSKFSLCEEAVLHLASLPRRPDVGVAHARTMSSHSCATGASLYQPPNPTPAAENSLSEWIDPVGFLPVPDDRSSSY